VHRDKPLHLTHDASMMLSAIDSEVKLTKFMPLIDEMVEEGLVVLSDVDIIRYTHRPVETT
jgi:PII-like signaling protein